MISKKEFKRVVKIVNTFVDCLEEIAFSEFEDVAEKNEDDSTLDKLDYHFNGLTKNLDDVLEMLDPYTKRKRRKKKRRPRK